MNFPHLFMQGDIITMEIDDVSETPTLCCSDVLAWRAAVLLCAQRRATWHVA